MDIYQRTCLKEGVLIDFNDSESEIHIAESAEEMVEEEEAGTEDEVIDIKILQTELECMKCRIQQLQLKLKMMSMEDCPCEPCIDFEVELTCSENKEICALQKNQHKLQCQINELISCCKFAKDQIKDLRIAMCERVREIRALRKNVEVLNSWKATLEHEFGVCIERFEYLKHVKAEWQDVDNKLKQEKILFEHKANNFVTKACLLRERNEFKAEINDIKQVYQDLCELQLSRFFHIEQRLNALGLKPIMQDQPNDDMYVDVDTENTD